MAKYFRYFSAVVMLGILSTSAFAGLSGGAGKGQQQTFERTLHINPLKPSDSRYAYLPFEIPSDSTRITVKYEYDKAKNRIDFGLFDSRSPTDGEGMKGFRGWSGSRRPEVMISRDEATPGYAQGDIPAGTWRAIFGLYEINPNGVDIKVTITVESGPASSTSNQTADGMDNSRVVQIKSKVNQSPAANGTQWFQGDLHMHTLHSDGNWTVKELADTARSLNLDFLVVTDHNTYSHHREIESVSSRNDAPLLIRGEEVTTYGGHANAWGVPFGKVLDFRVAPGDTKGISIVAADAHRMGALISINHPDAPCGGCSWTYPTAVNSFDSIEVWNSDWDITDEQSLRWWDELLRSGHKITGIGSSDSHKPVRQLATPTTHIAASTLTERQLLDGIKSGRVFVTTTPQLTALEFFAKKDGHRDKSYIIGEELGVTSGSHVLFTFRASGIETGASVSLISNAGTIRRFQLDKPTIDETMDIQCATTSYYRIEIRSKDNRMLAFTNPIYVKVE